MEYTEDNNRFRREEQRQDAENTEKRLEKSMRIPVITQTKPDSGRIEPAGKDDPVSQRQLEQDVVKTNPSVESMESRG